MSAFLYSPQLSFILLAAISANCMAATLNSSSARADAEASAVASVSADVSLGTPAQVASITDLVASLNNTTLNRIVRYATVQLQRLLRTIFGDNIPWLGSTNTVAANAAAAITAVARATRQLAVATQPSKFEYKVEQIR